MPVLKPDNTVRICGGYKLTAKLASRMEQYPLPGIMDLFANLAGGRRSSELDVSHAYHQLVLTEDSHKLVMNNTVKAAISRNSGHLRTLCFRECVALSKSDGLPTAEILRPFFRRQTELWVEDGGSMFWGHKLVKACWSSSMNHTQMMLIRNGLKFALSEQPCQQQLLSSSGLPDMVVSDNAAIFTSADF